MSLTKLVKLNMRARVAKALGLVPLEILRKAQRTMMVNDATETIASGKVKGPDWDYVKLLDFAETTWLLRTIFDAIIREACGPGWGKAARFVVKCTKPECAKESNQAVAACPACGSPTRKPDEAQGVLLDKLLADPNPEHEFSQIVKSSMWQSLAVDDWFLSIAYAQSSVGIDPLTQEPVVVRRPTEIWVEDASAMKIMADKHGRLGSGQFFCPACYDKEDTDIFYDAEQLVCPKCSGALVQTAYVQEIDGKITARFAKDEIIHGNSGKNLPRLFGKPKLVSLLRLILAMQYLDRYNLTAYSQGSLKGILAFPEMDQDAIDEMYNSIEAQLTAFKTDQETGESVRPNRSLWVGVKQLPTQINMLPPSKDMQAIEWYKVYREAIAAVYSVTPVFISIIESGRTGNNPEMQIDVMNRATREWQQNFEEPFNHQLLPMFGIYDWEIQFAEIEVDDELRRQEIAQTKANAASIFAAAGFTVTLDEEGELVVTGKALPPVAPVTKPDARHGSEASGSARTDQTLSEKQGKKRRRLRLGRRSKPRTKVGGERSNV
jgi:hypothetical protein